MKVLRLVLPVSLMMAAVFALPRPAPAQDRPRGEHIGRVIADCDARADEFQHMFRRALEHSGYRGTLSQADLDRHADALSRAMRRVRVAWNRDRDPRRTRRFVEEAIDVSRDINRVMNNNRFHRELHERWDALRQDLNRLAEAFELPRLRWD